MDKKEYVIKKGLNGSVLKWAAMISMFIDHFAASVLVRIMASGNLSRGSYEVYYRVYGISRNVGRLAFPIFCFLLVEGFCYTSSRKRYSWRLLLFALLSEIPFDLALFNEVGLVSQNVFCTLFLGFITIWFMEAVRERIKADWRGGCLAGRILWVLTVAAGLSGGCLGAELLRTDYGAYGVLLIAIFYLCRKNRLIACLLGYLSFLWEAYCLPGFVLVYFYNGKRGRQIKYLFYTMYPVHLMLFYGIGLLV